MTATELNLRSGPGTDQPVLNVLHNGDSVFLEPADQEMSGWVRVRDPYTGKVGYVSSEYLLPLS